MNTQNNLAALISSRICHDLISPIGAIGNGVELLGMTGEMDGPEMALINESVVNANARIRFFRIAFGAAKAGQMIGRDEISSVLQDINHGGRIQFDWHSDTELPREHVKLAFLLMQCFESALPLGGTVLIKQDANKWTLHCQADRINIDTNAWQLLLSGEGGTDISPSDVHFAIVADVVRQSGRVLLTDLQQNSISIRF